MNRTQSMELWRQLAYQKTVRQRTIDKHNAKIEAVDAKIGRLQADYAEAIVDEASKN